MNRLTDRVAIVTGAAGGLGSTICEVFQQDGAIVVPVDIAGDGCLEADVGTEAGNRQMVETALARHGRIDILVLNAGVQFIAPISDFPEREWDRLMNVMVKGPFFAMKFAWPALTQQSGGRIVVTASASSFVAEPNKAAYVAAKHAVLGLVKVAALEGALAGLTVNAVGPGWMRTPLVENQLADQARMRNVPEAEILEYLLSRQPIKRLIDTREVANLIAFLSSPESSAITGTCIPIDLGMLAS